MVKNQPLLFRHFKTWQNTRKNESIFGSRPGAPEGLGRRPGRSSGGGEGGAREEPRGSSKGAPKEPRRSPGGAQEELGRSGGGAGDELRTQGEPTRSSGGRGEKLGRRYMAISTGFLFGILGKDLPLRSELSLFPYKKLWRVHLTSLSSFLLFPNRYTVLGSSPQRTQGPAPGRAPTSRSVSWVFQNRGLMVPKVRSRRGGAI